MLRFVVVLSLAALVLGAPSGGHTGYGYQTQHCQTKYNIKYEQQCHQEYDVVVDTTYSQAEWSTPLHWSDMMLLTPSPALLCHKHTA